MIRRHLPILVSCLAASSALGQASAPPLSEQLTAQYEEAQDVREIRRHVESIFEAFIAADYDTVRATHTTDWRGIRAPNPVLVRGIDGYMAGTNPGSPNPARGYEFVEIEIDVEGDYATILYLARYFRADSQGEIFTYLLRSIDTYRRDPGGWNQCGSNICVLLDDPPHVPTIEEARQFFPGALKRAAAQSSSDSQREPTPLEPVDPEVDALINDTISALNARGHLDDLVTADWKGYGIESVAIARRDSSDQSVSKIVQGDVELADLELRDIEVQVQGDRAIAFFTLTGKARPEEDGPMLDAWLTFGSLLRDDTDGWKHATTHIVLVPNLGNLD